MSKINNNPIMKGLSGMLGDVVVFREQRGQTVMANKPKKREQLTAHQQTAMLKFKRATQYAKGQVADPVSKAEYETGISGKINSAYAAALTDCLKGPQVTLIDTSDYRGNQGNLIMINAVDNFKVAGVSVEIFTGANELVEKGSAIADPANVHAWSYAATATNGQLSGSKIVVKAKDKPNNITVKELVLA